MKRKIDLRLITTIGISGAAVMINFLINFFLTPYITDRLGLEAYGFVSVARNVISYADIIMVALSSFVVRYISIAYHEGDIKESSKYYSTSVFSTMLLSGVIFVVALVPIVFLEHLLNISSGLVLPVKILFVVTFANFIITTLTTPVSSALYIKNRLDVSGWFRIIGHLLHAVVLLLLLWRFVPHVWFVPLATIASSLFVLLGSLAFKAKKLPEVEFRKSYISLKRTLNILKNGIWNSLNSLGNVLNSGLDLIVANLMLTVSGMGQIAIAKSIGSYFSILYQTVFQPFQPKLLKLYAATDKNPFYRYMTKTMTICGCFSNIALAGFVALGSLFYSLWLPNQDTQALYVLTCITVFISITAGVMQPVYYVYTLTVKNKLPCWITIAGGLLNVASKFLLLKYTNLGTVAVVVSTTVIMLCINLFFNPIYAAKCLKIKVGMFYHTIIRHIITALIMIAVFVFAASFIAPQGWMGLLLTAVLLAAVGLIIHVVVYKIDSMLTKAFAKVR